MQKIISCSDQVALHPATQIQGSQSSQSKWGYYEVCFRKDFNDAYASSQNIVSRVAGAAWTVLANLAKTIQNMGIYLGNKVYNLLHPQASTAPAESDVVVEIGPSISVSANLYELAAEELMLANTVESAENELPELEVLEEPLELKAPNPWKKTHIAAGAALGAAAGLGTLHYFGVSQPAEQFMAQMASTVWECTGERIGNAAHSIYNYLFNKTDYQP